MEENYIELLKFLQLENDEIGTIQKAIVEHHIEDVAYNQISTIIKLFRMCAVSDNVIGKLIYKNLSMLTMSHRDLLKVVYVWGLTGTLYSIENRYRLRIAQLNRTYLRYLYLNSGNRYKTTPVSYDALISGEERFASTHHGNIGKVPFEPNYESLLEYYVPGNSSLEAKEEEISSIISAKALSWYLENLKEKSRSK